MRGLGDDRRPRGGQDIVRCVSEHDPTAEISEQDMTVAADRWAPSRRVLQVLVLLLVLVTVVSLAWLGATGAVPWGYNEVDRSPIWRQYILLSAVASMASGVLTFTWTTGKPGLIGRRAAQALGVSLTLILLAWGVALFTFGLWGGDPIRAFAVAAASVAPAVSVSLALVGLGYLDRRLGAVLASLGIVIAGAGATMLAFR